MNDEELMTVILNDMEMIVKVHDAIYWVTNQIIDSTLCDDLIEGSITLIKIISQNHTNIKEEELALIEAVENFAPNLQLLFKRWLSVANNDLFGAITELSQNSYDFSAEEMKSIIDYVLLIRYNDLIKLKSFFGFLTSKGHILPEETFGVGMYMLETYGFLKINPNLHPEYRYNPKEDMQHQFYECTICGSVDSKPHITVYSYQHKTFNNPHMPFKLYLKCEDCGNCYSKFTTSERFKRKTENKLFTPTAGKIQIQNFNLRRIFHFGNVINKIKNYNSNSSPNKNFLNIGISQGEILAVAQEYGYEVEGLELSHEKAEKVCDILQIPVHSCELLEFEFEKKYSAIIMEDIIEYEFDLSTTFTKISNSLEDDGVLWITTPNINSAFSRLTRERCALWIDPSNISLFSKEGLEDFLKRFDLKVVEYGLSENKNGYMEVFIQKNI